MNEKNTTNASTERQVYISNTVIHFDVSRSRSVKAIEEAMEHDSDDLFK